MGVGSPSANAPNFPSPKLRARAIHVDGLSDEIVERRHGHTLRLGFSHSRWWLLGIERTVDRRSCWHEPHGNGAGTQASSERVCCAGRSGAGLAP